MHLIFLVLSGFPIFSVYISASQQDSFGQIKERFMAGWSTAAAAAAANIRCVSNELCCTTAAQSPHSPPRLCPNSPAHFAPSCTTPNATPLR